MPRFPRVQGSGSALPQSPSCPQVSVIQPTLTTRPRNSREPRRFTRGLMQQWVGQRSCVWRRLRRRQGSSGASGRISGRLGCAPMGAVGGGAGGGHGSKSTPRDGGGEYNLLWLVLSWRREQRLGKWAPIDQVLAVWTLLPWRSWWASWTAGCGSEVRVLLHPQSGHCLYDVQSHCPQM